MQSALATRNQYRTQQRIQRNLLADLRRIWRGMGGDWDRSWARISPDVVGAVSSAQVQMARSATEYVALFLAEVDLVDEAGIVINAGAVAGYSSDGFPLDSLLYGSVVAARTATAPAVAPLVASAVAPARALTAPAALVAGGAWLGKVAASQIADVGRTVTSMETLSRPELTGYTRFLNPPSCYRCAILAGRVYRYSTGFERHPQCDCVMQPASGVAWANAEGFVSDPMQAFRDGQIRGLSRAETQAIEAGADINQVVNAHRGMKNVGVRGKQRRITTEGTSRRGLYGRSVGLGRITRARLTPEQIYRQARTRAEAIEYLRKYGYIF